MPVYTYRCENCGIQFEQTQKFSDSPLTKCPECGKKSLRKVYTPVGIVFKGSGFYATDHRSPSGTAHHAAGKGEETKSDTNTEAKPDTKSESAAESKPAPITTSEKAAPASSESC